MAYIVKYDDDYLFDPYTNDDTIYDAKISANVNAAVYFDFTIPPTHRLYEKIEEQAGIVRVYSDKKLLFMGEVTDIEDDFEGNKSISCSDPRMHLNDVLLRPYSTIEDEEPLLAPSSIEGYFQWLIDQYNSGTLNSKFVFRVGVNQGAALTKNDYIYIKNENLPGIGSELESRILDSYGGYLIMTYPNGIPTLNLYADVHEANTQIIDFGVNLIDFKRSSSTGDQYTAIRPVGGTPEQTDDDPEGYTPTPITIESLPDGTTQVDADYVKMKDVVYSVSRVNRYGYKEYSWTNSNILDQNVLLEEAVADLKKCVDPSKTLEVKAVDLALFMEGYDHLECGEVARIRYKPHNIDAYLLVNSMDINLQDPSQTTYTLGEAYNSLTGEQSSFVKSLNAGINSSLDKVAGLDQTVKDQAVKVDQAVTDASNAVDTANDANKVANEAQNAADNAQQSADKAQNTADSAQETADSAKQTADSANETANSAKEEVGKIQTDIGDINADLEKIKQDAQATSEKADAAAAKADEAGAKADALQSTVSNVQTTVNGVQSDVGELKTSVSGAVEKSNEALTAASSAQQNLDGFKMEVSQTYQVKGDYATNDSLNGAIAQEVLDRNSAISQSASEIKQTVSETYQVKGDYLTEGKAAETYATQSSVSQTANSIKSEVSKTYATIATVDGLKNIADNAIESWTGSTAPTTSNKPASDWTTAELKKQHSGDLYYDTSTGYSYRYGSNDGTNYSWTLVKDTDITKALANASAAKQAADTAQSGVDKINADLPVTYATKSDVTQTADSIKTEVSKTYSTKTETSAVETKAETAQTTADAAKSAASTAQSTANTAKQNAATAQTTADNAQSNLDAYKQTVEETYTTKTEFKQTADSINSTVSEVKQTADGALSKATTVEQTASGLTVRITQAEKDVDTAQATANTAKSTADSASKTASTASTNASTALNTANTAKSTADTANTNATEAKNSASTAVNTANTAKSTASTASTNATNALNRATYQYGTCATAAATAAKVVTLSGFSLFTGATIQVKFTYANTVANPTLNVNSTGAKTIHAYGASLPASGPYDWVAGAIVTFVYDGTYWNIADASSLSKANSAQSTANAANSTANTAKQNAATAQTTADAAKTAASNAQSTANTANSTANAAKTAAATAQSTANNAAKTATNYLKFDSTGLVVGDQTAGTLGKNVLIDADSVDIRTGSTVLASFGSNSISLGKSSAASIITMCKDAFELYADTSDGNTNAIIASNPSSGSGGIGSLELRSTNVGTARSSIKIAQTNMKLLSDNIHAIGNVYVDGAFIYDPTLLWSGTLTTGGSITIPRLPEFHIILADINNEHERVVCTRSNSSGRQFRGVNSSATTSATWTYIIVADGSGTTFKLSVIQEIYIVDANNVGLNSKAGKINAIYGLL